MPNFENSIRSQTQRAREKIAARRGVKVEDLPETAPVVQTPLVKKVRGLKIGGLDAKQSVHPKEVKVASALKEQGLSAMMDEDASANTAVAANSKIVLQRVAAMVALLRDAERRKNEAETTLQLEKAKLFKMETIDMPELLREAGLTELVLEDGTKVEIKDDVQCGITVENRPTAHKWLRDHGFGAIIKTDVVVSFGKDEVDAADKLTGQLMKKFGPEAVEQKEGVHAQTLKAFVREQIEKGVKKDIPPFKPFGINPYSWAKVTAKKVKGAL